MKLRDRIAIVTGAGRGIGAATALKLAREGARVLACDLDAEPLEQIHRAAQSEGLAIETLVGDVAAADFGERATTAAVEQLGGLDILINNAGYIWNTTIQNTTDEQWLAMQEVHSTATFRLLRAAFPHFKEQHRRGRESGEAIHHRKVVNVSSISGTRGAATQVAYSAAKASIIGITKTLAQEWGRFAVNVNAVAFGYIDTRLTQVIGPEGATINVHGNEHRVGLPQELASQIEASIPLGRRGRADEAAGAIYLLCLPESDFISGEIVTVSGGQ